MPERATDDTRPYAITCLLCGHGAHLSGVGSGAGRPRYVHDKAQRDHSATAAAPVKENHADVTPEVEAAAQAAVMRSAGEDWADDDAFTWSMTDARLAELRTLYDDWSIMTGGHEEANLRLSLAAAVDELLCEIERLREGR